MLSCVKLQGQRLLFHLVDLSDHLETPMLSSLTGDLSNALGVPLDQVTSIFNIILKVVFVLSQLVAICFSFLLKTYISPRNHTTLWRHLVEVIVGGGVMYFCYDR